jgi:hypothetical protein
MKYKINILSKFRSNIIAIVLLAVAIVLIANKLVLWGAGFLVAGLVVFGIQQLIQLNVKVSRFEDNINGLEEKNHELFKMNSKLAEENAFLKERHFQVTQIKSILELNMFEIDTKFKRSVNRIEQSNDREIKYIGCLNVSLRAKYGIDCRELRFKYLPESDELIVANIDPRFLSFGTRKLEWEFFEVLEYKRQVPFTGKKWMTGDDLSAGAERLKEDIRLQTEHSLENGPEEFSWIMEPIREKVENTLRIMFKGICSNILIAQQADDTFVMIDNLQIDNPETQKN